MKRVLIILFLFATGWFFIFGQQWVDRAKSFFNTFPEGKVWHAELEKQITLYSKSRAVVFLGDSHIEQCEWGEIFSEIKVLNRGIPGELTGLTLKRVNQILPDSSLVFLQIGINDVLSGYSENQILNNYLRILAEVSSRNCKVVPTLIFPTRFLPEKNIIVFRINMSLKSEFKKRNIGFIDLTESISKDGILKSEVSWDGVHLNATGYSFWIIEMEKILKQTGWADGFQ
jgi:lysophospholipase L1-like esterase